MRSKKREEIVAELQQQTGARGKYLVDFGVRCVRGRKPNELAVAIEQGLNRKYGPVGYPSLAGFEIIQVPIPRNLGPIRWSENHLFFELDASLSAEERISLEMNLMTVSGKAIMPKVRG